MLGLTRLYKINKFSKDENIWIVLNIHAKVVIWPLYCLAAQSSSSCCCFVDSVADDVLLTCECECVNPRSGVLSHLLLDAIASLGLGSCLSVLSILSMNVTDEHFVHWQTKISGQEQEGNTDESKMFKEDIITEDSWFKY